MRHIEVTRPSMPGFEAYCAEIRDLWQSRWLTNMGAKHDAFQRALEAFLGVRHVSLHTNGHLALENAIAAFDFPRGGEVITTPFTFVSTTHAIARNGLTPVFCDIRRDDFTLDASKLEALVTPKTVAIVPVHVYGHVCDVEGIDRIARRHGLKVIYDAAHAFAVRYRGRSAAAYGDAAVFSFHATKVFNTVEGGAVCFESDALTRRLDDLKNFGIRDYEEIAGIGGNAKMSEFQAAMGLCNLHVLSAEISRRRRVAERYVERLSGIGGLRLPTCRDGVTPNYAYFPVLFDGPTLTRDAAHRRLAGEGIFARKYFYPLTSAVACYRDCPNAGNTPVAAAAADQVLALPIYGDLSLSDVDAVCDALLREVKA